MQGRIGVLWEFFEYFADLLLGMDMQKDTVINAIHTVALDQSLTDTVIHVEDIRDVILVSSDGTQQVLGIGGYLDVGNHDSIILNKNISSNIFLYLGKYTFCHHYSACFRIMQITVPSQFPSRTKQIPRH